MDLQTNFDNVIKWGEEKGIIGRDGTGTIKKQLDKVFEEVNELKTAIDQYSTASTTREQWDALDEIQDAIGDSIITLILIAPMFGVYAENCLESALGVIQKRTGKMVDGEFLKDK